MPRLSHHEEMPGFPARPFASGSLRDRSPRHGWLERRSYSASNRTADRLDDDIDAAETITSRPSPWPRRRSSIVPVGQSALGSGSRPERRPEPTIGLLVQVGPAPGAGLEGEEPDALAAIADGEGRTGACGGTRPCPGAGLWPRPRSRPVSPPPGAVTMTGCAGGHRWPRSFVTKRRTLAYRPGKPWSSTRSSQVAMALRPRARACPMSPRYSSRALAVGARLAGGGQDGRGAGQTEGAAPKGRLAGFWRRRPVLGEGGGREVLAAFRYTGRLAPHARRRLDAGERPAEPAQHQDWLLLVVAHDVGHVGGETTVPSPPSNVLGCCYLPDRISGVHDWPVLGVNRGPVGCGCGGGWGDPVGWGCDGGWGDGRTRVRVAKYWARHAMRPSISCRASRRGGPSGRPPVME